MKNIKILLGHFCPYRQKGKVMSCFTDNSGYYPYSCENIR